MKKYHIATLLTLFALFLFPFASSADEQKQPGNGSSSVNGVRVEANSRDNASATGEVKSEKPDDAATNTGREAKGVSPRSEQAREHMSVVAQKVEELLTATGTTGGIGEQVSAFAKEQNEIRQAVSSSLEKVDKRGGFLKTLIGPDFQALGDIKKQITQNEQRVKALLRVKEGASEAVKAAVDQVVSALNQEIDTLKAKVMDEEGTFSFFGWFAKLFVK